MLNTSATTGSCRLLLLLLLLLVQLLQLGVAMPQWWWRHNDASYDASLDPVAWSRGYVQDTVRKPRISQPAQFPAVSEVRHSWWRIGHRDNNENRSIPNRSSKKRGRWDNQKKFVRRHRKRLLKLSKLS